MKNFDVIVIGAGPGGYTAALTLKKDLTVAIVDKRASLGGTCLNVGCIPSKALLEATEHLSFIEKKAASFGIFAKIEKVDFSYMMKKKEETIEKLANGLKSRFKASQIPHFQGVAKFLNPYEIEVNGEILRADRFIIATGAETIQLPFLPIDEETILSSTGALSLKTVPKSLLVVGAGVIGVEISSIYNRLGTKVTVVEKLDRVCPMLDKSLSDGLKKVLEKQGITFHLKARLTSQNTFEKEGVEHKIEAEKILVAIGRRPYTDSLNLKNCGVEVDQKGFIIVDDSLKTTAPHIFALGDVTEGAQLAHRALDEGLALGMTLLQKEGRVNPFATPNVIYTHPEVASVGLSEEDAKNSQTTVFSLKANGRALCQDETDGFVKIVFDKETKKLLGIHILSQNAGEMIGEGVVALLNKMRIDQLAQVSHAHPTLSEAIKEAALHKLNCD
jgi:dihydrolipoamide dehydrogenase